MATTITNTSSASYQLEGSTEVLTTTSNVQSTVLENTQGLTLTKTASVQEFSVGEIVTYTITITNNSGQFLNGVRIIDNLGGGNLAYVVGTGRLTVGTLTYAVTPVATNPLTFTLQQLNVGATMTLTYNCQVIFNLPTSVQTITNAVQGIGYTSTGTVTGFTSATIKKKEFDGNLSLNKSANRTNVFPGQVFSYILTLTNNTVTTANAISIVDQLPANFVVTSVTLRIGSGATIELTDEEYTLIGTNQITVPSTTGPSIIVPAGQTTIVTITGYFN